MDCYALLVSDNLLASSGIVEKSIVIFASKLEAQNGELAAVFLKKEMKIVVRRIAMDKNKVLLTTDKSECAFKNKGRTDEITILGKVISATFFPNSLKV